MKTAREVFSRAISLLNYTDAYGAEDSDTYADLYHRALAVMNTAVADLAYYEEVPFVELVSMDDTICLSEQAVNNILPYGVAMFIAEGERDMTLYSTFANIYNQKRASAITPAKTVTMKHSPFSWGDFR